MQDLGLRMNSNDSVKVGKLRTELWRLLKGAVAPSKFLE